ncbi:MAG: muramidase, partial [Mesorhizobium sp.]
RVAGTPNDIDVNVAPMDAAALRAQWPFGGLIDAQPDYLASIPLPLSRAAGLAGNVTLTYATVAPPPSFTEMVAMFST